MSSLYVTTTEFSNWPTSLDLLNLIPDGTEDANAAELAVVVGAACGYLEQITYQPLYARVVTETEPDTRAGPGGQLQVRLRSFPAQSIVAAQWKQFTASGWNTIPVANTQITGVLQQGYWADDLNYRAIVSGWGLPALTVMTQYVSGYPNALLTSEAAQGATTLDVDDATGMQGSTAVGNLTVPGTTLTIYDSGAGGQENVTVESVSDNAVTLAAGTLYAHGSGVRVSALPFPVTEAAIHLCAWIIKGRRAGGGISMDGTLQPMQIGENEDMQNARKLLQPYKRVT